jgi:hypothetical protein
VQAASGCTAPPRSPQITLRVWTPAVQADHAPICHDAGQVHVLHVCCVSGFG